MPDKKVNAPWATRDAKTPETAPATAGSTATPEAAAQGPAIADSSPASEVASEVTVTVTVPRAFNLRISHHHMVAYKAGVQEMPVDHAEHWYSKANGVELYRR